MVGPFALELIDQARGLARVDGGRALDLGPCLVQFSAGTLGVIACLAAAVLEAHRAQLGLPLQANQAREFAQWRSVESLWRIDVAQQAAQLGGVPAGAVMCSGELAIDSAHLRRVEVELLVEPRRRRDRSARLTRKVVGLHRGVALGGDPAVAAKMVIDEYGLAARHPLQRRPPFGDHDVRVPDRVLRRARGLAEGADPLAADAAAAERVDDQVEPLAS